MGIVKNTSGHVSRKKENLVKKREKVAVLLPLVVKYLNEGWSMPLACSKGGLPYQSYLNTLKEFPAFNDAYAKQIENRQIRKGLT